MAKKGKRCKRCGQVNPKDGITCVYCNSENDLEGVREKIGTLRMHDTVL